MIRTQVQLTEQQLAQLKQLSVQNGQSVAELVRVGIDRLLGSPDQFSRRERMQRAARVFGRFRSGAPDISAHHDDEFAKAAEGRL